MVVPTMSPCTFIYSPHPTFGVHKVSTLLGRLSVFAGLDYWTGLLDWTTGLRIAQYSGFT